MVDHDTSGQIKVHMYHFVYKLVVIFTIQTIHRFDVVGPQANFLLYHP